MKHTSQTSPLVRGVAVLTTLALLQKTKATAKSMTKWLLIGVPLLAAPLAIARAGTHEDDPEPTFKEAHPKIHLWMKRILPVLGGAFAIAVLVTLVVAPKLLPAMLLTAVVVF